MNFSAISSLAEVGVSVVDGNGTPVRVDQEVIQTILAQENVFQTIVSDSKLALSEFVISWPDISDVVITSEDVLVYLQMSVLQSTDVITFASGQATKEGITTLFHDFGAQLELLSEQLRVSETTTRDLISENDALRGEVSDLKEVTNITATSERLTEVLSSLSEEVQNLGGLREASSSSLESLKSCATTLSREVGNLSNKIDGLEEIFDKFSQLSVSLPQQLEQLRGDFSTTVAAKQRDLLTLTEAYSKQFIDALEQKLELSVMFDDLSDDLQKVASITEELASLSNTIDTNSRYIGGFVEASSSITKAQEKIEQASKKAQAMQAVGIGLTGISLLVEIGRQMKGGKNSGI